MASGAVLTMASYWLHPMAPVAAIGGEVIGWFIANRTKPAEGSGGGSSGFTSWLHDWPQADSREPGEGVRPLSENDDHVQ